MDDEVFEFKKVYTPQTTSSLRRLNSLPESGVLGGCVLFTHHNSLKTFHFLNLCLNIDTLVLLYCASSAVLTLIFNENVSMKKRNRKLIGRSDEEAMKILQ